MRIVLGLTAEFGNEINVQCHIKQRPAAVFSCLILLRARGVKQPSLSYPVNILQPQKLEDQQQHAQKYMKEQNRGCTQYGALAFACRTSQTSLTTSDSTSWHLHQKIQNHSQIISCRNVHFI